MNRLIKKDQYGDYMPIYHKEVCDKLYALEDLLEKYEIKDLAELEIALDQYYHRCDNVQTRRVEENERKRKKNI